MLFSLLLSCSDLGVVTIGTAEAILLHPTLLPVITPASDNAMEEDGAR